MAEPTKAELMRMIIRLDNKLNWLIGKNVKTEKQKPDLALFDKLPEQPLRLIDKSQKDEFTISPCNKNLSVWACKNICKNYHGKKPCSMEFKRKTGLEMLFK